MNAGFAVLYRWKVRPDAEEAFIAAWRLATAAFTTIGALGSRLHRGDDGDLYAYAEWPSREAWENAKTRSPVDGATAALMRDSTLEFEAKPLDVEADLLMRSAPALRLEPPNVPSSAASARREERET